MLVTSWTEIRQCQIDFQFSVTWKKNTMRDALKSFYFCKKKIDARKGIFFLFFQIVMEMLFMKEFNWEIFTNCNFADFAMITLCI